MLQSAKPAKRFDLFTAVVSHFHRSPNAPPGEYLCNYCDKVVVLEQAKEGAKKRSDNGESHLSACNPGVAAGIAAARRATASSADTSAEENLKEELVAKRHKVGHSPSKPPLVDKPLAKPLLEPRKFSAVETIYLYLLLAAYFALAKLGKDHGSSGAFAFLAHALSLPLHPTARTTQGYQERIAAASHAEMCSTLRAVVDFSSLPLLSLSHDIWSDHSGKQQMGIRVTGKHPWLLYDIMVPAKVGSLNAVAEADLAETGVRELGLTVKDFYSVTTDNAPVALAGARLLLATSIGCLCHLAALVAKATQPPKPKNGANQLKFDEWQILTFGKVARVLVGAAARAGHFNQSAASCRCLLVHQLASGFPELLTKTSVDTLAVALLQC